MVGLSESPATLITDIGVGKQQLVEIAKALSKEVKLLILDEPTASLNESDSDALLNLLLEFKKRGISSILISHKLNEISKVADFDHRAPRRLHGRNPGLPERSRQRGQDHPGHGGPAAGRPLSEARCPRSARCCSR